MLWELSDSWETISILEKMSGLYVDMVSRQEHSMVTTTKSPNCHKYKYKLNTISHRTPKPKPKFSYKCLTCLLCSEDWPGMYDSVTVWQCDDNKIWECHHCIVTRQTKKLSITLSSVLVMLVILLSTRLGRMLVSQTTEVGYNYWDDCHTSNESSSDTISNCPRHHDHDHEQPLQQQLNSVRSDLKLQALPTRTQRNADNRVK